MCDITEQSSEYQQSEGEELSAPLLQQPITENGSGDEEGEICAETPVMKHLMQIINIYSDQSGNFLNIMKGLSIMFVFGALLGLVMPNNSDLPNPWYQTFSSVIGYIYFVSWSVSFYPQIITNYQRKHITGLSTDASILAVLNYTCYAIYNVFFYFDDTIRKEYKNRHGEDAKITVQSNDVMFSIHALFLTCILLTQIIYYGGFRSNPISKITVLIVALVLLSAFAYMTCIYTKGWLWIDFLYLLATFKLVLTVLTYIPQVILNYWRQCEFQINYLFFLAHQLS
jgi:cystinosin